MIQRIARTILSFMVALSIVSIGFAQDDTHPLQQLFELVPVQIVDTIDYVDFRAAEAALGIEKPASFEAMSGTDVDSLWRRAIMRLTSLSTDISAFITGGQMGEMVDIVGFDFFDIDRIIGYGQPPEQVVILSGDFDSAAIQQAYEARDYTSTELGDSVIWKYGEGNGLDVDLSARNMANPFGGKLGRREPLAVLPEYLADSPVLVHVERVVKSYMGETASLAEHPDYRAALEALLTSEGKPELIVQANFIAGYMMMYPDIAEAMLGAHGMPNSIEEIRAQLGLDSDVIAPPYSLMVMVDGHNGSATEGEQVAMVALVYPDAEQAQIAIDVIGPRLEEFAIPSMDMRQPIAEVNGTFDTPYIYENDFKAVAIFVVRYPPASQDASITDTRQGPPPGALHRYWMNAIIRREFFPVFIEVGD